MAPHWLEASLWLRVQPIQHPGEGYRLPDMLDAADPGEPRVLLPTLPPDAEPCGSLIVYNASRIKEVAEGNLGEVKRSLLAAVRRSFKEMTSGRIFLR